MSEARRELPDLPSRYRGPAFRAIVDVLREDPVLLKYVKTWRVRDGAVEDFEPVTDQECPLIAVSPVPRPSTVLTVQDLRIVFQVRIRIFVGGTNVDDLFALWEAVEDAVVDGKPFRGTTVREYLCGVLLPEGPAGIYRLHPETPAFDDVDIARPPKSRSFQTGAGSLTCFFRRPSAKSNLPA